jgi:hypothetical protein
MVAIVPSYLTKLRTAKEDLVRLEEPIPQFFVNAADVVEQLIITPLIPFVRPDAD